MPSQQEPPPHLLPAQRLDLSVQHALLLGFYEQGLIGGGRVEHYGKAAREGGLRVEKEGRGFAAAELAEHEQQGGS